MSAHGWSPSCAMVEKAGGIQPGKSVMVVPTAIGASMNEGSRLWEPENMDINRRFPGDPTGSTTERIAGALLERLKNYRYGVQLTSFYQPGSFIPHGAHDEYRQAKP